MGRETAGELGIFRKRIRVRRIDCSMTGEGDSDPERCLSRKRGIPYYVVADQHTTNNPPHNRRGATMKKLLSLAVIGLSCLVIGCAPAETGGPGPSDATTQIVVPTAGLNLVENV